MQHRAEDVSRCKFVNLFKNEVKNKKNKYIRNFLITRRLDFLI